MVVNKMGIQHNHYADPTNKVGCDQWNDEHKIVNMLGYELIEEKVLTPGSGEVTWNGLLGNEDEEYYLEVLNVVGTGTGESVTIYFNEDLTVANYYHLKMLYNTDSAGRDAGTNGFNVAAGAWNTPGISNSKWQIRAKTGIFRVITGDFLSYIPSTGKAHAWVANYVWKNSTDEITKIRATYTNVASGTIRLWRRIPING